MLTIFHFWMIITLHLWTNISFPHSIRKFLKMWISSSIAHATHIPNSDVTWVTKHAYSEHWVEKFLYLTLVNDYSWKLFTTNIILRWMFLTNIGSPCNNVKKNLVLCKTLVKDSSMVVAQVYYYKIIYMCVCVCVCIELKTLVSCHFLKHKRI